MARRRNRRGGRGRASFAKRVRSVFMDSVETKRKTAVTYSASAITTTVNSTALHDISTGDTKGSRDGEETYMRTVYGRLTIAYNPSATLDAQVIRFVLYHPYQQDDLLTTLDYTTNIEPERYNVFLDKMVTVTEVNPVRIVKIAKKFWSKARQGMKMTWKSGTGTDITKGALYLAVVSDHAATAPSLNGNVTVYYKDP